MNPDDGYISYIINPSSGTSSLKRLVVGLKEYLEFRKFDVRLNYTRSLSHGQQLAAEAVKDPECKVLIVSGGDGTIREISKVMIGSGKPILPVPGGTENLLASELGYDERLETLIKAFEACYTVDYDLCKSGGSVFASISGFGFDAEVVHRFATQRCGNVDQAAYFWPIWRTYWTHKFPHFTVEVDGKQVYQGPGMVFVGNSSRYAMGLHILKNADYSDGKLDVCIYRCTGHVTLVKDLVMTALKLHTFLGSVVYYQGKNVKVSSVEGRVYSQFDGDPGPRLPVEIEVIPSAVKFIVPKGAKPAGLRTRFIRLFQ